MIIHPRGWYWCRTCKLWQPVMGTIETVEVQVCCKCHCIETVEVPDTGHEDMASTAAVLVESEASPTIHPPTLKWVSCHEETPCDGHIGYVMTKGIPKLAQRQAAVVTGWVDLRKPNSVGAVILDHVTHWLKVVKW